ncbi:MAG: response regulator [Cyanobacteria bacterium J06635_1]
MPKILLVEDNALNQDMLSRRLRRHGYTVSIAKDGQQGLVLATEVEPDLILMDMNLPVLDGWQATQQLKADQATRKIPIIALTTKGISHREKALSAGCDEHETKPIDFNRLQQKIASFVGAMATAPEFQPVLPQTTPNFSLSAPKPDSTAKRLLVVDDNTVSRELFKDQLQRLGYEVRSVAEGPAALQLILEKQAEIDLVLLDLVMPQVDGWEILGQIRQRYSRTELPVIMVTAKDHRDDMVRAFDLGANDYITKDSDFAVAIARIRTQLDLLSPQPSAPPEQPAEPSPTKLSQQPPVPPNPKLLAHPKLPPNPKLKTPAAAPIKALAGSGLVLANRYQVCRCLVEAQLDQLFLARETEAVIPKLYILKKIDLGITNPKLWSLARKFFKRELRSLEFTTQHDQIASPVDVFIDNGAFYIVYPFVEGQLLSETFSTPRHRLSSSAAIALAHELLTLLEPFHRRHCVHGDLQINHLLRRQQDQQLMLFDLGITQRLLISLSQYSAFHRKELLRQRGHIPMEQRIGEPTLSSDLYAVGVTLLWSLVGPKAKTLTQRATGSKLNWRNFANVSDSLAEFIDQLLCLNYRERFADASSALRALVSVKG